MAKTLTATDRKALIRLTSTLPVGSPERRVILAGLRLARRPLVAASENPTWDKISKAWAKAEAGINKTDRVDYSKVKPERAYMSYKFMSTFAAHDNQLWEISAARSRGIILKALKSAGAKIGSVPPMNDFGTKETPFTLDGLPFVFGFNPHRYDMGLYINPSR